MRDPGAMEALFRALGFTETASVPAGSGAQAALRNPATAQEVILAQADGAAEGAPREGDVSVGVPVGAVDLAELLDQLRAVAPTLAFSEQEQLPKDDAIAVRVDGQRLILTRKKEPFFVIHYSPAGWEAAAPFYEATLGFCFFPLPNRGEVVRTRFENAGGRVDIEVSPDVQQAAANVEPARWVAPPGGGTGVVRGPFGELIELVDRDSPGDGR
ncbi:MAG: hypothetical protein IT303_03500 [Dehalococcoidia bacterium]|nr:hypothetical protein [Dehalococcoidia bacterium]